MNNSWSNGYEPPLKLSEEQTDLRFAIGASISSKNQFKQAEKVPARYEFRWRAKLAGFNNVCTCSSIEMCNRTDDYQIEKYSQTVEGRAIPNFNNRSGQLRLRWLLLKKFEIIFWTRFEYYRKVILSVMKYICKLGSSWQIIETKSWVAEKEYFVLKEESFYYALVIWIYE